MEKFKSQAEAKRVIQASIDANDRAVYKALALIYSRQTEDEKRMDSTVHDNHVGFSGVDAGILSSFHKQMLWRGYLTPKQLAIARKKMRRYWKQLAIIAGRLKEAA